MHVIGETNSYLTIVPINNSWPRESFGQLSLS